MEGMKGIGEDMDGATIKEIINMIGNARQQIFSSDYCETTTGSNKDLLLADAVSYLELASVRLRYADKETEK